MEERLLERHAIAICISCKQVIHTHEPMLETIHGPYHAPPKPCVEGR